MYFDISKKKNVCVMFVSLSEFASCDCVKKKNEEKSIAKATSTEFYERTRELKWTTEWRWWRWFITACERNALEIYMNTLHLTTCHALRSINSDFVVYSIVVAFFFSAHFLCRLHTARKCVCIFGSLAHEAFVANIKMEI